MYTESTTSGQRPFPSIIEFFMIEVKMHKYTCGLLLMHVNGDASLQVGPLDLGQLTTQGDHDHLTENGFSFLHVLGHDGLVCPCKC